MPVYENNGFVLIESLAINLHISRSNKSAISPSTPLEESQAIQWAVWAMGELEGPHDSANRRAVDVEEECRNSALSVLNQHLAEHSYLISERFTVADLNVAALLMSPKYMPFISNYGQVESWFKRCATRPALAQALDRSSQTKI